jgi:hypothetical protein
LGFSNAIKTVQNVANADTDTDFNSDSEVELVITSQQGQEQSDQDLNSLLPINADNWINWIMNQESE